MRLVVNRLRGRGSSSASRAVSSYSAGNSSCEYHFSSPRDISSSILRPTRFIFSASRSFEARCGNSVRFQLSLLLELNPAPSVRANGKLSSSCPVYQCLPPRTASSKPSTPPYSIKRARTRSRFRRTSLEPSPPTSSSSDRMDLRVEAVNTRTLRRTEARVRTISSTSSEHTVCESLSLPPTEAEFRVRMETNKS